MVVDDAKGWKDLDGVAGCLDASPWILRGEIFNLLALRRKLPAFASLYLLGADVLDGFYDVHRSLRRLALARLASTLGLRVTLVGFSVGNAPVDRCLEAIGELPTAVRLRPRDEESGRRLERWVTTPIRVTADPAFLLSPVEDTGSVKKALAWVSQEHELGRLVVGVNVNAHLVRRTNDRRLEPVLDAMARSMQALSESTPLGASFVFVPHDLRKGSDDRVAGELLRARLESSLAEHYFMPEPALRAAEVKGLVSSLDLVLTGRMHLAIAALGCGVPVGCITYGGKFEGLLRHFQIEDATISTELVQAGELPDFVLRIAQNRTGVREKISHFLPQVRDKAKGNFS